MFTEEQIQRGLEREKSRGESPTMQYLRTFEISPAYYYYYYYFLSTIHKLTTRNIITPYWLTIDDIYDICKDQDMSPHGGEKKEPLLQDSSEKIIEKFENFPNNRWLSWSGQNPYLLGEDIVKNGYYVPFFMNKDTYRFAMGSHRINSLIGYHNNCEKIKKSFLCFQYNFFANDIEFNAPGKPPLELYYLTYKNPTIRFPDNIRRISGILDTNGGACTNLIFDYNKKIDNEKLDLKKIIPAPCLNKAKDFNDFISQPFDDKIIAQIQEYYPLSTPFKGNYNSQTRLTSYF